jgi:hypothetical protein
MLGHPEGIMIGCLLFMMPCTIMAHNWYPLCDKEFVMINKIFYMLLYGTQALETVTVSREFQAKGNPVTFPLA